MQWENVSDEQLINEVRKRGYIIKDAAITMTRDDIIRMAQEAGFDPHDMSDDFACNLLDIERFAALVAAAEREACAKVCDARVIGDHNREDAEAKRCAAAIRARGEL